MARYQGDPRWIEARYKGRCGHSDCDEPINVGDRVFYYPSSRTALAKRCGHAEAASRDFEAHRQDEDGY